VRCHPHQEVKKGANKGDVLNCRGKMPSLRKAGLPRSCDLPEHFGMSPLRNISTARPRFSLAQHRKGSQGCGAV
jgi:hypothetical protein